MKRNLVLILSLMLMLTATLAAAETRFEGEGFDSPEAALTAYFEAFNAGDVETMLSTFAVETYVDRMDREASVAQYSFAPSNYDTYPLKSEYMRGLLVELRRAELAKRLAYQYMTYAWPEARGAFEGIPVYVEKDEAGDFLADFDGAAINHWMGGMEFVGMVDLSELNLYEEYASRMSQDSMALRARIYGCDQLEDVAARLRIDGEDYILLMEAACYDGVWFNVDNMSTAARLIPVSSTCFGLYPAEILID